MPRMEVTDCRDGHGKACKSRPWRIFALLYCCCECHRKRKEGEVAVTLSSPEVAEIDPRIREIHDELMGEFGPPRPPD